MAEVRQRGRASARARGGATEGARPSPRKIFVAYPYAIPQDDYRRPFTELAKAFNVKFEFADEQITSQHILDKITRMILSSRFSLFDITRWNANVTLELGIAIGQQRPYYLLFNPKDHQEDLPADLGGLDRIQYTTYTELETGLTRLLVQEFGVPRDNVDEPDPMAALRVNVLEVIRKRRGPKMRQIADDLQVPIELAKAVVRPMVENNELVTTGQTRGMRYYLAEDAP